MSELIIQTPKECQALEALKTEIESVSKEALLQRVGSTETKDAALAVGAQVKRMRKALADRRTEITAPMNDLIKQIIAFEKALDAPLARAEDHIRAQAVAYANAIAEEQRKERVRIQMEKDRIEAERQAQLKAAAAFNDNLEDQLADQAKVEEHAKALRIDNYAKEREVKAQGVKGTREEWTFEILDPALVPDKYFIIDEALIRNAVRIQKIREIPGVRIYSETKVSLARY